MEKGVYNHKKIVAYIANIEKQVRDLRMIGKQIEQQNQKSIKFIVKISENKNNMISGIEDKSFKKMLSNVDYIIQEKQHHEGDSAWVKGKLFLWVALQEQQMNKLKEKAKNMESKRLNKALSDQDINKFKKEFTESVVLYNRNLHDIISSLSQWKIKEHCQLIQKLTTTMNNSNLQQKKQDKKQGKQKKK